MFLSSFSGETWKICTRIVSIHNILFFFSFFFCISQALFNTPTDVVLADDGTLFICDQGNNQIRSISKKYFESIQEMQEKTFFDSLVESSKAVSHPSPTAAPKSKSPKMSLLSSPTSEVPPVASLSMSVATKDRSTRVPSLIFAIHGSPCTDVTIF